MKNYGIGNIVMVSAFFLVVICCYLVFGKTAGLGGYTLTLALTLPAYMLINAPVINVNEQHISVFTINPFTRNLKANVADIEKVLVDITDAKFRITLQMKNGSYQSALAGRYNNMKPVYEALKNTGIAIESDGIGTIDWAS